MAEDNGSSNRLVRILRSKTLAGAIGILGLALAASSLCQQVVSCAQQRGIETTRIAQEDRQIALTSTQSALAAQRATDEVQPHDKHTPEVGHSAPTVPAQPSAQVTATRIASTVEPLPAKPTQTQNARGVAPRPSPRPIFEVSRIPAGTEERILVEEGTLHVWTCGPVCVEGVCLPGGVDRGSVLIFRPRASEYTLTHLVPLWNYHGAFYASIEDEKPLAEQHVAKQKIPGTCSTGTGCAVVDVLILGPQGVVDRFTR